MPLLRQLAQSPRRSCPSLRELGGSPSPSPWPRTSRPASPPSPEVGVGRLAALPDHAAVERIRSTRWTTTLSIRHRKEAFFCCGDEAALPPTAPGCFLPGLSEGLLGSLEVSPGRGCCCCSLEAFFGLLEFAQRRLPAPLQFGGHQAVVRVGLVELPLGQAGLVAQPFESAAAGLLDLFVAPGAGRPRPCRTGPAPRETAPRGRAGTTWSSMGSAGRFWQTGHLVLLAQVVAEVAWSRPCTARPSCARTRRSRRCRAAGPCPAAARPASCCGRTRCGCRGSWPGFSQKCPSRCRPDTCPGCRLSTGPSAAASARAGAGALARGTARVRP